MTRQGSSKFGKARPPGNFCVSHMSAQVSGVCSPGFPVRYAKSVAVDCKRAPPAEQALAFRSVRSANWRQNSLRSSVTSRCAFEAA
ncbi:hypothetical protein D9M68_904800 [compost metagenome]